MACRVSTPEGSLDPRSPPVSPSLPRSPRKQSRGPAASLALGTSAEGARPHQGRSQFPHNRLTLHPCSQEESGPSLGAQVPRPVRGDGGEAPGPGAWLAIGLVLCWVQGQHTVLQKGEQA